MYIVVRISVRLPIGAREVGPLDAHFKVERTRAARVHVVNVVIRDKRILLSHYADCHLSRHRSTIANFEDRL